VEGAVDEVVLPSKPFSTSDFPPSLEISRIHL
jgi:hypothetical protein